MQVITVDLPSSVDLEVVETDPGVRGNTASGGSKPATLETGAVSQVPLFINGARWWCEVATAGLGCRW